MIREASEDATPGALVHVHDRMGAVFGVGLWNPHARVPLRMVSRGTDGATEGLLERLLDRAVDLRLEWLRLPEATDAFRVVNSDGDGLGGLIVDRYADVLSVQVHSLGIAQRVASWVPRLHARLGTRRVVYEVDPVIARQERIPASLLPSDAVPPVKIQEQGVRHEVDFSTGHKTGFFCDQRDNRRRLAALTAGRRVLDLCCYTGGFALAARVAGGAAAVTGVDLDERAVAQARRNANLNGVRVDWVHCDAFSYARQMRKDGRRFDVVILDPPKLLGADLDEAEGLRRYEDLNILGASITEPGGLLVTCSCSGQLSAEAFEQLVVRGVHRLDRTLQILDHTGPGADHPVMSSFPEGRYLKVLWGRVLAA
ncbi:MAG: class I SAM-dependent rRNA methyltransferase [Verrucomicrobiae bacterium]|nr:class I SAM-dependent rRNA methyltransferase [Verrucomicrobiae bacterium]